MPHQQLHSPRPRRECLIPALERQSPVRGKKLLPSGIGSGDTESPAPIGFSRGTPYHVTPSSLQRPSTAAITRHYRGWHHSPTCWGLSPSLPDVGDSIAFRQCLNATRPRQLAVRLPMGSRHRRTSRGLERGFSLEHPWASGDAESDRASVKRHCGLVLLTARHQDQRGLTSCGKL